MPKWPGAFSSMASWTGWSNHGEWHLNTEKQWPPWKLEQSCQEKTWNQILTPNKRNIQVSKRSWCGACWMLYIHTNQWLDGLNGFFVCRHVMWMRYMNIYSYEYLYMYISTKKNRPWFNYQGITKGTCPFLPMGLQSQAPGSSTHDDLKVGWKINW